MKKTCIPGTARINLTGADIHRARKETGARPHRVGPLHLEARSGFRIGRDCHRVRTLRTATGISNSEDAPDSFDDLTSDKSSIEIVARDCALAAGLGDDNVVVACRSITVTRANPLRERIVPNLG